MGGNQRDNSEDSMTTYEIISKKRDGNSLSPDEINHFIDGYTHGDIPDYQMSALLMAIYLNGMNDSESQSLMEAYLHSGQTINLDQIPGKKVDKHSTGGVGDKVSIILAPIVAAAGVNVPMISGRGLGHSGGTLDKLESIPGFRVDYSIDEFKEKLGKIGACLIGQTSELAPADKKIYALRDVTATVQSIPLICASIMSKKIAEGIDALVLDVKTGTGAFMSEYSQAIKLAKSLIRIGEDAGKKTIAYITNMNNPLGNTIGNWLEIRECIDCLHGEGPGDLMEVTFQLAGAMIYLGGKSESVDTGIEMSKKLIISGNAWEKFLEIVKSQEGEIKVLTNPEIYPESVYQKNYVSTQTGWIESIDALEVGSTAVTLGAGRFKSDDKIDPKAGIRFHFKVGDKVEKDAILFTVYTEKREIIEDSINRIVKTVKLNPDPVSPSKMILEYLDSTKL
jgi:pyrimidine-nucleoside phosphorylase